ncbi:hypothetical protein HBI22_252170 [Parastagonospora nodorum]|nr:hypothetical protein HBI22_252170 [Parastagonospora nodorum]
MGPLLASTLSSTLSFTLTYLPPAPPGSLGFLAGNRSGYFLFNLSTSSTTASSSSPTSYSTTWYRMFFRVVCSWNHASSCFGGSSITFKNICSSLGCSVAVKYTICVSA